MTHKDKTERQEKPEKKEKHAGINFISGFMLYFGVPQDYCLLHFHLCIFLTGKMSPLDWKNDWNFISKNCDVEERVLDIQSD